MNFRSVFLFSAGISLTVLGFYLIFWNTENHTITSILIAAIVTLLGTLVLIGAKVYLFIQITKTKPKTR